jgi:hypothetical protein
MSDVVADSVISVILQVESSPASIKRKPFESIERQDFIFSHVLTNFVFFFRAPVTHRGHSHSHSPHAHDDAADVEMFLKRRYEEVSIESERTILVKSDGVEARIDLESMVCTPRTPISFARFSFVFSRFLSECRYFFWIPGGFSQDVSCADEEVRKRVQGYLSRVGVVLDTVDGQWYDKKIGPESG